MNGKTHQLVGMTGSLLVSAALLNFNVCTIYECAAIVGMGAIGSYIPDIDHTGSVVGKKVSILSYPIRWTSYLFRWLHKKTDVKLFKKISEMFAHRGIFHAPILWAIGFLLAFLLIPPLVTDAIIVGFVKAGIIGLFTGIFLHIGADMLNPTGVPILMPIINKKISIGKIVTGSRGEFLFKAIMLFGFLFAAGILFLVCLNTNTFNLQEIFREALS